MEIKVYSIQLDIPTRAKRIFLKFGIPALLFIGMIGVVRADAMTIPNTFSDGDVLSASKMNANFSALADAVNTMVPPGAIMAYYGTSAPDGWLIANGATLDKKANPDYTDLVNHLRDLNSEQGTSNLSDSNQAKLPDLRGYFLRGQNRDAGVNPDAGNDLIGQVQEDAFESHSHTISPSAARYYENSDAAPTASSGIPRAQGSAISSTAAAGGSETRPKNVTVLFIIKY